MEKGIDRFKMLLVAAPLLAACVTKAEHEELMAAAQQRLNEAQQRHQVEVAAANSRIVSLQTEVERLKGEIADRDTRIATLQAQLDEATTVGARLRNELEKAGKDVDKLLGEKSDLSKRLAELRKAQAAAQARAELFQNLALKFKKMIDAGDLKIVLRDGRMVLQLRNDVLFDSGKVTIKDDGKAALTEVAGILVTLTERKLQVAGHTDNVPISTQRFPSNWELSTARSVNVVKYLVEAGVKAEALSAAGYSEHDPVASNESVEDKAKNRRIEIVLQPNIAELVQVPGT